MAPQPPYCIGSQKLFKPETFLDKWSSDKFVPTEQNGKPFADCIIEAFALPVDDNHKYKALGDTTLSLTQRAINGKRKNNLHNWYPDLADANDSTKNIPTLEDIQGYTSLFLPAVNLRSALSSFQQAKKDTLRHTISTHLHRQWHLSEKAKGLLPAKKKGFSHVNPYFDLWAYSCRELEWAGPTPSTANTHQSHHILPVFYHHFGCVVPSYAALSALAKLAQPAKPSKEAVRPILDIGSGNGYWTFMLRSLKLDSGMKELVVLPVDDGTSEYRTLWVPDTIVENGITFLRERNTYNDVVINQGRGCVLLLVYPQAQGDFTSSVIKAYQGDTIVITGTQTQNYFTGFQDELVEEWMGREKKDFEMVVRVPLPSFAGKDEGLYIFQRKH